MPISRIHIHGKRPRYLYVLRLRLLFIERRRLSCFFHRSHTLQCIRAAPTNGIECFFHSGLSASTKHYKPSGYREGMMSFPANHIYAASPPSALSGGTVAKQQHSNASSKTPCRFVVASCNLFLLVGVIDPISTSATETHNNLPMTLSIQSS